MGGKSIRKRGDRAAYPPAVTDEFVSLVQRIFPLSAQSSKQQCWSLKDICALWEDVKLVTAEDEITIFSTLRNACKEESSSVPVHLDHRRIFQGHKERWRRRAKVCGSWCIKRSWSLSC